MLRLRAIEKNVKLLHTPYCDFTITDEEGNSVGFDIMESPEKDRQVWLDDDENQAIPVKFGEGKTLRLYTKDLEIKRNYYIRPSLKLIARDSDERLFTHGLTGEDYTFAVSFPDPNEMEKFEPDCTEDDFHFYNIEYDDGIYVLRLYDRDNEYIDIFMFWIWNIQDHMPDYESACDIATWWCP